MKSTKPIMALNKILQPLHNFHSVESSAIDFITLFFVAFSMHYTTSDQRFFFKNKNKQRN